MSEVKVAILIPCYNAANYLPELFEGIKNQTIPFDEVICYDDYSTDKTAEIAEALGAIVIKGIENKGPAFARNRLIEATTCNWIHFHDADDLIDIRFLAVTKANILNENTQFLCNTIVLDRANRKANLGNITYDMLNESLDQVAYFLDHVGFASMGLYAKSALTMINGFREDIKGNEDPDLHVRLAKQGFKIKNVSNFLVTKLEHSNSFSHQNWMKCLEDKLTCYEGYLEDFAPRYHLLIGKHIAWLGSYFYSHGNNYFGKKALKLVKKSGLKSIENTTPFSHVFTKVFGISNYYKFLELRHKFKAT